MAATPVTNLSCARKVAVLLVAMGSEKAADVVRHLDPAEVQNVANEIIQLGKLDEELARQVIDDFGGFLVESSGPRGGTDYARTLLEKALGAERADQLLGHPDAEQRANALESLRDADPGALLGRLRSEVPQIVAAALASLPVAAGATVLSGLPAAVQLEVATKIATMRGHRPEVVAKLAEVLQRETPAGDTAAAASGSEATDEGDGPQRLVDLLMRADRETEQRVLDSLAEQSPELAQQVRDKMFVFEDLVNLDEKAIQLAIRSVEMSDLCLALKSANDDIKEAVFRNMSERAAAGLREDLETLTSAKARDIGAAQKRVVAAIIDLANQGQIELKPEKEEESAEAAATESAGDEPADQAADAGESADADKPAEEQESG
jgi:flagellar motor switch protein FliG